MDTAFAAGASTEKGETLHQLQGGDHDPRQNGFTLRTVDLSFAGGFDPVFDAFANMAFFIDPEGETRLELEEAFLQTQPGFFPLEVRAGQFFTEFGLLNPTHIHDQDFLDAPFMVSRFFGPDGMRGQGARVAWRSEGDTPFEILASVQNSQGETQASFRASDDLDGYIARGNALRKGFVHTLKAGGIAPGDARFPDRFRRALTETLETERDAGTIEPMLQQSNAGLAAGQATDAVRDATRVLPAKWIDRANDTPVRVVERSQNHPALGSYDKHAAGGPLIVTDATPGNALHEYVHHLQDRLPDFDDLFQQLHRRRTAGDPVLPLTHYSGKGREYDHKAVKHRPALEVVTRAFQLLFHRLDGPDGPIDLDDYLRDDPEMVDLVIGMLFHYDPPTGGTP